MSTTAANVSIWYIFYLHADLFTKHLAVGVTSPFSKSVLHINMQCDLLIVFIYIFKHHSGMDSGGFIYIVLE